MHVSPFEILNGTWGRAFPAATKFVENGQYQKLDWIYTFDEKYI